MRNKLTVPWTSRLSVGRLFQWSRNSGRATKDEQNVLKEDDLDHLGALHSSMQRNKRR